MIEWEGRKAKRMNRASLSDAEEGGEERKGMKITRATRIPRSGEG